MKKNVRLLTKQNKHWYSHEKNTKWAIQDKKGYWWLVNGSEFPERKIVEVEESEEEEGKEMKCGLPPTFDFKKLLTRIVIGAVVGSIIGIALGLIIAFS